MAAGVYGPLTVSEPVAPSLRPLPVRNAVAAKHSGLAVLVQVCWVVGWLGQCT